MRIPTTRAGTGPGLRTAATEYPILEMNPVPERRTLVLPAQAPSLGREMQPGAASVRGSLLEPTVTRGWRPVLDDQVAASAHIAIEAIGTGLIDSLPAEDGLSGDSAGDPSTPPLPRY